MKITIDILDEDIQYYQQAFGVDDPTPYLIYNAQDSFNILKQKQIDDTKSAAIAKINSAKTEDLATLALFVNAPDDKREIAKTAIINALK